MNKNDFVIICDSDSDLPIDIKNRYDIPVISMPYTLDGEEYFADLGITNNIYDFYKKMRNGSVAHTSALPVDYYIGFFEPYLKNSKDILFIAFSNKLSTTIDNINEAKKILIQKYNNRKIEIVDTLSISLPESILIMNALELYESGASLEEIVKYLEENKLKTHVYITVEDLVYFKRGGRISGISAFMGSLLSIKPIITLSKDGSLIPIDKSKGRQKSIKSLIDYTEKYIRDEENQTVIILHADCMEEAKILSENLKNRLPKIKEIRIDLIGEVIGSHCGPGTIGIAFKGTDREF